MKRLFDSILFLFFFPFLIFLLDPIAMYGFILWLQNLDPHQKWLLVLHIRCCDSLLCVYCFGPVAPSVLLLAFIRRLDSLWKLCLFVFLPGARWEHFLERNFLLFTERDQWKSLALLRTCCHWHCIHLTWFSQCRSVNLKKSNRVNLRFDPRSFSVSQSVWDFLSLLKNYRKKKSALNFSRRAFNFSHRSTVYFPAEWFSHSVIQKMSRPCLVSSSQLIKQ